MYVGWVNRKIQKNTKLLNLWCAMRTPNVRKSVDGFFFVCLIAFIWWSALAMRNFVVVIRKNSAIINLMENEDKRYRFLLLSTHQSKLHCEILRIYFGFNRSIAFWFEEFYLFRPDQAKHNFRKTKSYIQSCICHGDSPWYTEESSLTAKKCSYSNVNEKRWTIPAVAADSGHPEIKILIIIEKHFSFQPTF